MKLGRYYLELELARRCWNVEDLAKAAGIKVNTIEQALNGNDISTKQVGMIAKALEIDPKEIVSAKSALDSI